MQLASRCIRLERRMRDASSLFEMSHSDHEHYLAVSLPLMQTLLAEAAAANIELITEDPFVCSPVNDAECPAAGLHSSSLCSHPW